MCDTKHRNITHQPVLNLVNMSKISVSCEFSSKVKFGHPMAVRVISGPDSVAFVARVPYISMWYSKPDVNSYRGKIGAFQVRTKP